MDRPLAAGDVIDSAEHWPIRTHRRLAHGSVCDFVEDRVAVAGGGEMVRQYTVHPGAVAIIAWDDQDRIAVVRQYRHPVAQRLVEPPAGLLDHDEEDPLVAAQRELAEEVGLAATEWRVLVDLCTSPGATQESVRVYLATVLSVVGLPAGFVPESEEAVMDSGWAARSDLVDGALDGRLQNPVLVAGVMALETVRLSGRLDTLRGPESSWQARAIREAQNRRLADAGDHAG